MNSQFEYSIILCESILATRQSSRRSTADTTTESTDSQSTFDRQQRLFMQNSSCGSIYINSSASRWSFCFCPVCAFTKCPTHKQQRPTTIADFVQEGSDDTTKLGQQKSPKQDTSRCAYAASPPLPLLLSLQRSARKSANSTSAPAILS